MEGWIKLHRNLQNWEWYQDSKMVHLFYHLMLKANHKEGNWRGINVKRGQLITGRKRLSEETGISEQSIRTCLRNLEKTGEITMQPTRRYSVLTICKYDEYQDETNEGNQHSNQQRTMNKPAKNQALATNKNDKKENNENNEKEAVPPSLQDVLDYFKKNNFPTELAKKAYDHYSKLNWKDSKKNKVTNWQEKMQRVWFKDENRVAGNPASQKSKVKETKVMIQKIEERAKKGIPREEYKRQKNAKEHNEISLPDEKSDYKGEQLNLGFRESIPVLNTYKGSTSPE